MATYDKYYQQENYFGNPYPELLDYVSSLDHKHTVLDLGCGQGRDVIGIARLGFSVTGVDISKVGIHQMNDLARKEELNVTGIVSDLNEFDKLDQYDIILLDSMFHFYKNDIESETATLQRIISESKKNAHIIIIVQEGDFRINQIKNILDSSQNNCTIVHEESFVYEEFNSNFYMIACQKG